MGAYLLLADVDYVITYRPLPIPTPLGREADRSVGPELRTHILEFLMRVVREPHEKTIR